MKIYETTTHGETILISAKTRKEAYARFFLDIKNGKYPLDKIGGIIMVQDPDDGQEYPFRTTPTLWLMGLISEEVALATIANMIGLVPGSESAELLKKAIEIDGWILKEIERLEEYG